MEGGQTWGGTSQHLHYNKLLLVYLPNSKYFTFNILDLKDKNDVTKNNGKLG